MNFIKFKESNGHEGEDWYFFLQFDGNEEELKKLEQKLDELDLLESWGDTSFRFNMNQIPESEVDILIKHSPEGYMSIFNKVTGKLSVPEWNDEEDALEALYKGGIERLFK